METSRTFSNVLEHSKKKRKNFVNNLIDLTISIREQSFVNTKEIQMALLMLVGILLISTLSSINAQCFIIGFAPTLDGKGWPSCAYKGLPFAMGSSFHLAEPDCLDCDCTASGLGCCSSVITAYDAGDCGVVREFCQLRFVDKQNASKPCSTSTPTTTTLSTDSDIGTTSQSSSDLDNSEQSQGDSSESTPEMVIAR
jgi:hypothetical protein